MLNNSADFQYIQKMFGHVSILKTQIYIHVSCKKLSEVYQGIHLSAEGGTGLFWWYQFAFLQSQLAASKKARLKIQKIHSLLIELQTRYIVRFSKVLFQRSGMMGILGISRCQKNLKSK